MQPGQVISGKYRLLRLLGDGGMGAVYEAHHEVLGARVAIKVLHEDLAKKPELVDRFLREARVLAQISSPHVVRVLDIAIAEAGGPAYIVMELLSGEALSAVIGREQRLALPIAVDYAKQVLEALSAAHAIGVVHRDLKPENILVTRDGERTVLKVIDFGIAKAGPFGGRGASLTVSGALMGTPEYMAPEQAHSADQADARSDIFAVGVILYEMLSGARPVDGEDPRVVAMKVERGEVQPLIHRVPEVPRDLAGLVHRAMAARPELRFASASEMRLALDAVLAGKRASTPSHHPSPPSQLAPSAVQAAPAPLDQGRGTGTMFGAPAGDAGQARRPAGATDPGAGAYAPGYPNQGPAPGGGPPNGSATSYGAAPSAGAPWAAQPGLSGGGYGGNPQNAYGPAPRGRGRGGNGTVLLLVGLLVLIGSGVAIALLVNSSGGSSTPPAPTTVSTNEPTPSATPTTPPPDPASDPAVGPLPAPTSIPTPHQVVSPPRGSPSSAPSGSPSGTPSTAPPPPDNPFGIPPLSFPNGLPAIPNPFPSPATSGVGPVMNIPTSFPPFGLPPNPTPSSAPPGPHHSNH